MAEYKYYSYENLKTGEWQGLLRLNKSAPEYEYAGDNGWQSGDPADIARKFFFPGSDAPDLIPRELAEKLAKRYGVTLD